VDIHKGSVKIKDQVRKFQEDPSHYFSTLYIEAVEKQKDLILGTECWLWAHPEIGYKEWKCSAYLKEQYDR
jgi:hypothetical protein